jgi:hypothetical protein
MRRDSKTDLAEPYEVRPSIWRLVGLATAKTPRKQKQRTHMLFLAKQSSGCAINWDEAAFAKPSHVWYWYGQLIV